MSAKGSSSAHKRDVSGASTNPDDDDCGVSVASPVSFGDRLYPLRPCKFVSNLALQPSLLASLLIKIYILAPKAAPEMTTSVSGSGSEKAPAAPAASASRAPSVAASTRSGESKQQTSEHRTYLCDNPTDFMAKWRMLQAEQGKAKAAETKAKAAAKKAAEEKEKAARAAPDGENNKSANGNLKENASDGEAEPDLVW
ncbi:hypothetical protein BDY21DRAFT_176737 [Lineolata rhizophorae]|uniref:Uncharacterized protein n=1 Tax=Lineolata rhizophorae TaxID=578093 RepID=A0A6A6P766_9PEZI|nr:hypothetical protein BDY21DRAFT_176737 [Lineolata rhizophorae]